MAIELKGYSPFVDILLEEGHKAGLERGLRVSILNILRLRFPKVSKAVVSSLEKISDPALLEALLAPATTAASMAEFQKSLRQMGAKKA